jgi:hypothetical protein
MTSLALAAVAAAEGTAAAVARRTVGRDGASRGFFPSFFIFVFSFLFYSTIFFVLLFFSFLFRFFSSLFLFPSRRRSMVTIVAPAAMDDIELFLSANYDGSNGLSDINTDEAIAMALSHNRPPSSRTATPPPNEGRRRASPSSAAGTSGEQQPFPSPSSSSPSQKKPPAQEASSSTRSHFGGGGRPTSARGGMPASNGTFGFSGNVMGPKSQMLRYVAFLASHQLITLEVVPFLTEFVLTALIFCADSILNLLTFSDRNRSRCTGIS